MQIMPVQATAKNVRIIFDMQRITPQTVVRCICDVQIKWLYRCLCDGHVVRGSDA